MILQTIFLVGLSIATACNLLGHLKQIKKLYFISKPFLIPCIIGFYVSSVLVLNPLIVLALVFGLGGDVFLLWRHEKPKAVVFGLLSFMLGHVFYIISFASAPGYFPLMAWWFVLLAIPYGGTAVLLFKVLEKDLGKMKVAATVYMGVLLSMSFFALGRLFSTIPSSSWITWLGSAIFVLSDAILAVEYFKLKREILHHAIVMATYIGAQFLIVLGLVV